MQKKPFKSSGSRNLFYFNSENLIYKKFKNLIIKTRNKSGRNDSGSIVFRSRSSLLIKQKKFNINYNLSYKILGIISSFSFIPFKNKLLTLVFFSNGGVSYFLSNDNFKLFDLFYNKLVHWPYQYKSKIKTTFFFLYQLPKLSIVSNLEIYPKRGVQYVRSTGVGSKIISFDRLNHSCLIKLPSGIKKIFSIYSFCFNGKIALPDNRYHKCGKAGLWRTYGYKSIVRGVAMNPVDHPNGGRTKSVKTPLTPWGKIAKKK